MKDQDDLILGSVTKDSDLFSFDFVINLIIVTIMNVCLRRTWWDGVKEDA